MPTICGKYSNSVGPGWHCRVLKCWCLVCWLPVQSRCAERDRGQKDKIKHSSFFLTGLRTTKSGRCHQGWAVTDLCFTLGLHQGYSFSLSFLSQSNGRLSIREHFSKSMLWAKHASYISACSFRGGEGEVGSLLALPYEQRLHYEAGAVCSPQRLGFSMVHIERMN